MEAGWVLCVVWRSCEMQAVKGKLHAQERRMNGQRCDGFANVK
jgi:hypothetical protein